MKKRRQNMILSIISRQQVETQEELAELLNAAGFSVTQATVSRDIRELNLTKISGENGKQIYISIAKSMDRKISDKYRIAKEAIVSADCAGNLLVIKTRTGMGMAVAVDIDDANNQEILGTIAGDDVVFCAIKTEENANKLKSFFLALIGIED